MLLVRFEVDMHFSNWHSTLRLRDGGRVAPQKARTLVIILILILEQSVIGSLIVHILQELMVDQLI